MLSTRLLCGALLLTVVHATPAEPLPLFDGHIHYSENTWELLSPQQAIDRLRAAGIVRALVSSSSDAGTRMLYAQAPGLVIPALRPYRDMAHQWDWVHDKTVVPYLAARLLEHRYAAIGEFHVDGMDADLPNIRAIVRLARQYDLFLHVQSDADAVVRMFRHDPQARILWAHAGFEEPEVIAQMLARYPRLWCDLSMRSDIAREGSVLPQWRELFSIYPQRFLVGSDTYVPEQWDVLESDARWTRNWLADLPAPVRERIAYKNGEELFSRRLVSGDSP